jgi:hypothetical protein
VDHAEYASYNWTGAPANYALTTSATDGGDSSKPPSGVPTKARYETYELPYRTRESKQMVPIRRPGIHHRGLGHGAHHGARPRIPLLRPRATKIRSVDDVGVYGSWICHYVPVVLVGILVGVLADWAKWIHWGSPAVWVDEHTGKPQPWFAAHPQPPVRFLSGMFPTAGSAGTWLTLLDAILYGHRRDNSGSRG